MNDVVTSCGHPNRAGARFCSECGAALTAVCPTCNAKHRPGARFCDSCGSSLALHQAGASAEAPLESERKQVTVLFADVAKSMDLAERLDPDELTQVMTGLVEVCREAVEHFGGAIDKFTGDGVMALFGAPLAQEDHARRACHAALRLVERAATYAVGLRANGIELSVRVGLNSGGVVAGSVGEAFTAVGHTVGLAQRMEAAADPGTVRLSEHTAALIGTGFRLRDLGLTDVKGSSTPLRAFALDGAAGGSAAAGRGRTGSARLVGRDEEFATLAAALRSAMDGRAQVIGIVGEAGAGKSRLCEEVADEAARLGITVRRTAGVSHAQNVPLLPILGFVRDYFAITDSDAPADVRAKVGDRLLGLDPGLDPELGLIFDFLEVPDPQRPAPQLSPQARQRRVLDVFRRATARRSEQMTILFIFEDVHWFDSFSVAFLEAWLPSFPGSRSLVLLNFRPEFHEPWRHSYYRRIPLAPLDSGATLELLDQLLGGDPSVSALSRELRTRTGGNPFFIEEIVRSLATDGTLVGNAGTYRLTRNATEVRVPATVQAVLAGRIDRLDPTAKSTLQAAAVIGRTFTASVLGPVSGLDATTLTDALRMLCVEELLQETGPDGDFRFWHPLTQEVAYGTLLTSARRRLHGAVAQALITQGPERHDELAALIATHYEAAGDDLEAARWQWRAARRAMATDFVEAQRLLTSSIEHSGAAPHSQQSLELGVHARLLRLRVSTRTSMAVEETNRLYDEAHDMAQRLDNPLLPVWLDIAVGNLHLFAGDPAGAMAVYRRATGTACQQGDITLQAFTSAAMGIAATYAGPLDDGRDAVALTIELTGNDPLRGLEVIGYSMHDVAHFIRMSLLVPMGQLGEARQAAAHVRSLFARRPMLEWHTWALSDLCQALELIGDPSNAAEAEAIAQEAHALAADTGNVPAGVKAQLAAGSAALLGNRAEDALEHLHQAQSHVDTFRFARLDASRVLTALGRAHLALGDGAAARTSADAAVVAARRERAAVIECTAHLVRAQAYRVCAAGAGDLAQARTSVEAGKRLALDTGAATYLPFLAEERVRLDDDEGALKVCADGYDAIGATGHASRLRAELGGEGDRQ